MNNAKTAKTRNTLEKVTVIEAKNRWWRIDFAEIWEYRHLTWMFSKRNLTSRYKQSIFGPLWFIFQPLLTAFVFYFVFGVLIRMEVGGLPRMLHYLSGMIFWYLFTNVFKDTAQCFIKDAKLCSKTYFPRFVLPFSLTFYAVVLFFLNVLILVGFFLYYHFAHNVCVQPNKWLWFTPLCMLYVIITGLGAGMLVASLTVRFRDLQFALNTIIQFWMYGTPIIWARSMVKNLGYQDIIWWNPMVAPIEIFRYGLTGMNPVQLSLCLRGIILVCILFCVGMLAFNRAQRKFIDYI